MTAFLLLQALCQFLRDTVKDYAAAQGDDGEYRIPRVFDWYLPFKNPKVEEKIDFPYITPRIRKGEDLPDDSQAILLSTVHIDISFGVYREGTALGGFVHPDGAYDLLNLMEHVRIALFRKSVLDNKYSIEKPYKWEIPDEQPYPLWVGQAQTIWTVQSATQQYLEDGVDIHGLKFDYE
ncbi:hypothetical protein ACM1RC_26150 [Paenibacillus azoreducens]|uniref:hypothetical protein n=1 Tax=Paenibacillus azoreducens TaxID=116718 RepID=UPI0039F5E386